MQQCGSNYFTCRQTQPHPTHSQNSTFIKHGYVAYQNKCNHECSSMVANILSPYSPSVPWGSDQKVKIQLFQNMVMLHKKLTRTTTGITHGHVAYQIKWNWNVAACTHIFCAYTHPRPLPLDQMPNHFF